MTEVETVVRVDEVVQVVPMTPKALREAARVATKARIAASCAAYAVQKARNEKTAAADLAYAAERDGRAAAAELAWLNN